MNLDKFDDLDVILDYIQTFVVAVYNKAQALVDTKTMNFIDPIRCFDDNP